jgi:hypothetical protein
MQLGILMGGAIVRINKTESPEYREGREPKVFDINGHWEIHKAWGRK